MARILIQDTPAAGLSGVERPGKERSGRWLHFERPLAVLEARCSAEVPALLEALDEATADGLWAVGFLAYEAAPAFDPAMVVHDGGASSGGFEGPPLAWWGLFRGPRESPSFEPNTGMEGVDGKGVSNLAWSATRDQVAHAEAIEAIRAHIAAGDTYQVNYTFPFEAPFEGDPWLLFSHLWRRQRPSFGAFVDPGPRAAPASAVAPTSDGSSPWAVCSVSPELFFRYEEGRVITRPMKGTSPRGRTPERDRRALQELRSEKNRAENLMIVDMMRNDLGRIAEPGSVRVRRLFAEETYPTVHQMVSEVRARTSGSALDVLRALFPCASITGAPKIRTMELIRQLEPEPRGLYTGTIGYLAPDGRAQFNVAIRTAVIGRRQGVGSDDRGYGVVRYGTGGGIVWDSEAAAEYRECHDKALILSSPAPPPRPAPEASPSASEPGSSASIQGSKADFYLFETMLYRPRSGFFLLQRHLDRLQRSALALGFPWDRRIASAELEDLIRRSKEDAGDPARSRVKLEWRADGTARSTLVPWPCAGRALRTVVLDDRPVSSTDPWLRHKTSHRQRYEAADRRFPDADEVLLWNENRELTETTRANLVLRFGDRFLTPPLSAGLLPGTYRAELLERGRLREQALPLAALAEADAVFAVNALRGWVRMQLRDSISAESKRDSAIATAGTFRRAIGPEPEIREQSLAPCATVLGEIR